MGMRYSTHKPMPKKLRLGNSCLGWRSLSEICVTNHLSNYHEFSSVQFTVCRVATSLMMVIGGRRGSVVSVRVAIATRAQQSPTLIPPPSSGAASPTLDETIVTTKRRCYSVSRRSSLFVCVSLNTWNDIDTVFGLLAFRLSWLHCCTISILFIIRFIGSLKSKIYIPRYLPKRRSSVISEILDFVHYLNQIF